MRLACLLGLLFFVTASPMMAQQDAARSAELKGAYSFKQGGWTYVHLEGAPHEIGFQHGYLLKG